MNVFVIPSFCCSRRHDGEREFVLQTARGDETQREENNGAVKGPERQMASVKPICPAVTTELNVMIVSSVTFCSDFYVINN